MQTGFSVYKTTSLGVDHDRIILPSTSFPTIAMLGTNCFCNVTWFYVGNKRYCIVLCCVVLYCTVLCLWFVGEAVKSSSTRNPSDDDTVSFGFVDFAMIVVIVAACCIPIALAVTYYVHMFAQRQTVADEDEPKTETTDAAESADEHAAETTMSTDALEYFKFQKVGSISKSSGTDEI